MSSYLIRDGIDLAVKLWSFFYAANMPRRKNGFILQLASIILFSVFVMGQRYLLTSHALSVAFLRNLLLYLLTLGVQFSLFDEKPGYSLFIGSVLFFLWGGWLKLFSPYVFITLGIPTLGYGMHETFPILWTGIAEAVCRVAAIVIMKRNFFRADSVHNISIQETVLALLPALIDHTTILIVFYITVVAPSDTLDGIAGAMTLLIFLLVFGMPCMLAASEKIFQLKAEQLRLTEMENQLNSQLQTFERTRQTEQQIRSMNHDFNKHLAVLRQLLRAGDSDTQHYLDELYEHSRDILPRIHTGNDILDALLNQKLDLCEAAGIRFDCMVDFKRVGFISPADLITIFSNAIDNAMEAVSNEKTERWIQLGGGIVGGNVMIKMTNPYSGSLKLRNGVLLSSKADAENHGIGLANIRRIVEKYNGIVSIDTENQRFLLQCMIPFDGAK